MQTDIQQINKIMSLEQKVRGEFKFDELHRLIYSTDASDYSEKPLAVFYPKTIDDIKKLIEFANKENLPLIPRGGGTSLAGQVVGKGLVVDVSKHLNKIIEINKEEKWVRVEPGVIPDVLNIELKNYGLFWGPETSTSNRNTLGGMVGNNSCGSHFPLYGNTRENLLEVKGFLADGTFVHFKPLNPNEVMQIIQSNSAESKIYHFFYDTLSIESFQNEIFSNFPKPSIRRRNSGYAIDALLNTSLFMKSNEPFNISKLIAGSEGTLIFITEIKLNLVDLPPKNVGVIVAHFNDLIEAMRANIVAMEFSPGAVELIDNNILELTKENPTQSKNRDSIKGEPAAILVIEFARENEVELDKRLEEVIDALKSRNLGYYYPIIKGNEINKIWELRKAGLGLLSNIKSDERSVTVIEDTAVDINDLPDFTIELQSKMKELGTRLISYAHIATGEIHFHPILNLKTPEGVKKYREVLVETAKIVKKYRGSLCGEHGDGRLRGEMIPYMFGDNIYNYFKQVKSLFDPKGIFNPGKIIDAPPMNTMLRWDNTKIFPEIQTYFSYDKDAGFHHAVERCNGSGDCRRPQIVGGTMCPSYRATLNEKDTTRARANALREVLLNTKKGNPFDSPELLEVFKLCLSCKACKSECPSGVDVTKLKAEFLQHYYDLNGTPLSALLIGFLPKLNKIAAPIAEISNFALKNKIISKIIKSILHFDERRDFPLYSTTTLEKWANKKQITPEKHIKTIYLFADEFTNYNDTNIGIKTVLLLTKLGYKVIIPKLEESGRTYLSKGLVKQAKKIATRNIKRLSKLITDELPLVGIEPSAILTFRDEYPELVSNDLKAKANFIAKNTFLIDEFLASEISCGNITNAQFSDERVNIKFHTHCHQKALASSDSTIKILKLLKNATVTEIPSGCCGMAGAFGFEKDKYDISMKIGELVLFPEIRKTNEDTIIVAAGTSCRHQIKDGTQRNALHPIEVLFDFLK
ncbi:MAG: FAD-binding and (Fe-S)-binding domain-containing protein [Candidatus Kapaibacteriota bacterium]